MCSQVICCPACHGRLEKGQCQNCGELFDNTFGVLDLRWPRPDPEGAIDADSRFELAFLQEVLPVYENSSYRQLIEIVMRISRELLDVPEQIIDHFENYRNRSEARGKRMLEMFNARLAQYFPSPKPKIVLDVGCGVGAITAELSRQFECAIGLDPMLSNLLLAQKYFSEQGLTNGVFVQGYAQQLPIADESVNYSVALNVIEHLIKVEETFHEIARVLRPRGCFVGDSRNRYDLFFPEPHIKVRFFGFIPRAYQKDMAHKLRNMPYDNINLLSARELKRYARQAFGNSAIVTHPRVAAYGVSPIWDKRLATVFNIPVLGAALLAVFPTLLLIVGPKDS